MEDKIVDYLNMSDEDFNDELNGENGELVTEVSATDAEDTNYMDVDNSDEESFEYSLEDEDTEDEDTEDEDTEDEDTLEEEILESTDDEDEDNSNVDDEEESDEEVSETKTFTLKYNKEEFEVDEDKVKELAQKAMYYDFNREEIDTAKSTQKKITEAGLSQKDLDAYIKFKNDPENGLTDFFALNGIDVDSFREELYEVDKEDVEERQEYYAQEEQNFNPVTNEIIPQRIEVVNKVDALTPEIPGLGEYSMRKVTAKDTDGFNNILDAAEDGSFDRAKKGIQEKFLNMTEYDQRRLKNDDKFFISVYNECLTNAAIPAEEVKAITKPSNRMSLEEQSKKNNFSKPRNQSPTKVKKKEKSTKDRINDYLDMTDEEFNASLKE